MLVFVFASCTNNRDPLRADIYNVKFVEDGTSAQATFAGGCFWCTEAVFERVRGVTDVISGYTGGTQKNPTYKQVSYGKTDHAEGIQVTYQPDIISYAELVEIFFATHDPTTLNRQGPDVGRQYRSAVYFRNDEEKQVIQDHIKDLTAKGVYADPIVTEVEAFTVFYPAEDYHQDYYQKHPDHPYIQAIAKPKVQKFQKRFKDKLKTTS